MVLKNETPATAVDDPVARHLTPPTTLPCTTARCTLGAALMSPACAGQTIPASVTGKLTTAETLIDQARRPLARRRARSARRRGTSSGRQAPKATRAAKGKKQ